jgi:signal transduction histidine kinase
MSVDVGVLDGLFLFENCAPAHRHIVAMFAEEVAVAAGTVLLRRGDPATLFFVLLDGEVQLRNLIGAEERIVVTNNQRGVYAGPIPMVDETNVVTAIATVDSRFLQFDHHHIAWMLEAGFPIARHLLAGIRVGSQRFAQQVSTHDKLAGLGKMAASLAHELNNPASAIKRSADELRRTVATLHGDGQQLPDAAVEPLTGLARSDRIDEIAATLERRGFADAWDLAPVLADAGADESWLKACGDVDADDLRRAIMLRSLDALAAEIGHAADRMSELVAAIKGYSSMDRDAMADETVHPGLIATIVLLKGKLRDVRLTKHLDPDPARVRMRLNEMNQVWTNLLDNAIDALVDAGTPDPAIEIATSHDETSVTVAITDNGPGIDPAVRDTLFQPFVTTKPSGDGTGLGLDISRRIVVEDHGGQLTVVSHPGRTTFTVTLPR